MLFAYGCGPKQTSAENPGLLFVTSGFTDEVWILDAGTGEAVGKHSLDMRRGETDEPHGVAVSPDGSHWYATLAHGSPTLWKYDATDNRRVGRLELPTHGASRIGISPSGRRAWIPDYWRSGQGAMGQVAAVDLVTLEVVAAPTVCAAPHDAQVDPSGGLVAVTCAFSDEIVFLDARSTEVVSRVVLEGASSIPGSPVVRPMNVVWSPDGSWLYVTLMGTNEIAWLDMDGKELGRLAVGVAPAQLALTRSGATLVVANRGDASVSIVGVEASTGRPDRSTRVELPDAHHPHGVALNGSGSIAFVSYEGTTQSSGGVVALVLKDAEQLWRTEVGAFTLGVAWTHRPARTVPPNR